MPYLYDSENFTIGTIMFGSSDIATLVHIYKNYKLLICSSGSFGSDYYGSTTVEIGGMPMVGYKMQNSNTISLRVFDVDTTILDSRYLGGGLHHTTTVFHGNSVDTISDNLNNNILSFWKLGDNDYESELNSKTNFNGMDLLIDGDKRLTLIVKEAVSIVSYGKFMFGNKRLVCIQDEEGWSPLASIDTL